MCRLLEKRLPVWSVMTPEQKQVIARHSVVEHYPKGTCIHGGEANCAGVVLLDDGMLRVYLLSEDGKEATLYRLRAGDVCILSASCVLAPINFDVHIDAEADSEAVVICAHYFAQIAKENSMVECFAYKLAAERFSDAMHAVRGVLFYSVERRLALFLLQEMPKEEGDTIHMTHEKLAKYLCSAREVVTRMLRQFAEEGVVEISRKGIKILDKTKLQRLAQSHAFL
jgi:CRP/FNR family transcriptional regulator